MKTPLNCHAIRFCTLVSLLPALALSRPQAKADTVSWTGATGSWSQIESWDPHPPALGDTVMVTNNGIVTLDIDASIGSLVLGTTTDCANGSGSLSLNGHMLTYAGQMLVNPCGQLLFSGGTVYGTGSATMNGTYYWSGGSFPFGGVVRFGSNAVLNITLGTDHDMPGVVLTNYGTVAWSGGRVRGGGTPGTVIYNYGVWDSQGDLQVNSDFQQQGLIFNNLGTFRKSVGTNSTIFAPNNSQALFKNMGSILVQTGSVVLYGGASFMSGSVSGAGVLYLAAPGTFNFSGTITSPENVVMTGGTVVGDNTIIGGLSWYNGNWNNASSVTLAPASELDIISNYDHDLANCLFTNLGTVEWIGGRLRGGGAEGTVIYNQGLWDLQCDQALNSDFQQAGVRFYNQGTLRKTAGTNATTFAPNASQAVLINTGQIDLQSGALVLNGGGVLSGGQVSGSGVLYLNAGSFTLNGTVTTTNVLFTGGSFVGNNTILGGLSWVDGDWDSASSVTVANGAELDVVSGNDHDLYSCFFVNQGTVEWLAGRLRGGGTPGTAVYNMGLWETRCDQVFNSDGQQSGLVFLNLGTFRKLVTTGSTTFSPNASQALFINSGAVDIQSGTLVLNSGAVLTNGVVTGAGQLALNAGTFTVNETVTTRNVQLTGGAFAGDNALIGGFTWAGGNWNGADSVTITANSELAVVSTADHDLTGCVVTNLGRLTWLNGRLRGGGTPGTVVYNFGTWDAQCDQTFNSDGQQLGVVFHNLGEFRKSAGTDVTTFWPNTVFNNRGTLNIQQGGLQLYGGGSFSAGAVTGPGAIQLAGGGFTVNGTLTTTNVQLAGGQFVGTNVLQGGFSWVNGTWNNAAVVTVGTNSELDIASNYDHDLVNCLVTNFGKVEWLGGRLRGGGTPGTVVRNVGLWEARCDQTFNSDGQQNGIQFFNSGTFRKLASSGITVFLPNSSPASFNNTGLLDMQSGSLTLNGGGLFTGGTVTGPGAVYLAGGAFTLNGTVTTLNVQLAGAILSGVNLLQGGFTWSSGNLNGAGPVTVASGAELDIVSTADHDLSSCVITNLGTVKWLNGRLRGGGTPGTVIYNRGLWHAQCDQAINTDYQQFGLLFNNLGTFRKSASTGVTTFSPNSSQLTFNNLSGRIELLSGTLSLPGNFDQNGGTLAIGLGGASAGQWGRLVVGGQATLNGALSVSSVGGYGYSAGDQFQIVSCANPLLTGQFSAATLTPGLTVQYFPSSVVLLATNGVTWLASPSLVGGQFQFSFQSVAGLNYTVEQNVDLTTSNWVFYTNLVGNGSLMQVVAPATNPPVRFFRVRGF